MHHVIVAAIQRVAMTPFALVCSCGEIITPPPMTPAEKQYEHVSEAARSHVGSEDWPRWKP